MPGRERSKKTLCEKSMKIVTTMIKVSSISLVNLSLGRPQIVPAKIHRPVVKEELLPRFPVSLKSEKKPSKPVSFLMQPSEREESSYVVREEMGDNDAFSDYINRFHKKNGKFLRESRAAEKDPRIAPPPTRTKKLSAFH